MDEPAHFKRVVAFLVRRSGSPHSLAHLLAATLFGSTLELVVIPVVLVYLGRKMDDALALSVVAHIPHLRWLAVVPFLAGIPWLAWSIYWQHRKGEGTPLPLVPTRVLLCDGPYRFTRNPMALGAILWLAGWALLANSPSALFGGVGIFALLVLSWDKWIEERELLWKHGTAYEQYRRQIPFLVPRFRSRQTHSEDGRSASATDLH
ncbi:MAG TPA: isoprenylcysteine carboxylmethyltransferase family protein [Terriglobales bacterium]|nr:isoprenylcysteine carboxylmethyltransferase family protein [Terriglobales bacterium]